MRVDHVTVVQIGSLVFTGGVLHAQLRHTVVLADGKAAALDVDGLAQLVVAVQGGKAELHADDAGLVLDVQFPVDIS